MSKFKIAMLSFRMAIAGPAMHRANLDIAILAPAMRGAEFDIAIPKFGTAIVAPAMH